MAENTVEQAFSNGTADTRISLLDELEAIKREHPELDEILQKFQIDQAEYDRTMLAILASELQPHNTYATGKESIYA
jgi:hypothetical protein